VLDIREYLDSAGQSPFADWLDTLNAPAAAKVTWPSPVSGKAIFQM
jgi:hypothetical protein